MRLRDAIASDAMAALIVAYEPLTTTEGYTVDECAFDAYLYADAMLHERKQERCRRFPDSRKTVGKMKTDKVKESP